MISMMCSCGTTLQVGDEFAGRIVACPKCGAQVTAPSVTSAPPVALAAPEPPSVTLPRRSSEEYADAERLPVRSVRPVRRRDEAFDDDRPTSPTAVSGKAIGSLICGLLTFCVPVLMAIPAIVLGFIAQGDVRRSKGRLTGGGMALAGIILGFVGNMMILFWLLVVAAQKVREESNQGMREVRPRTQCANNLKQIGLAMHSFHDIHKQLPPAVVYDANGKPLYSWRVLILPYIEQHNLYNQFKLDEPWDSPNNIHLLHQMPSVYAHPTADEKDGTVTYFQVFDGPAGDKRPRALFASKSSKRIPLKLSGPGGQVITVFQSDSPMRFANITDGSSNTIMVAEAAEPVPWSKPADLSFEPGQPLPKLGGHFANIFLVGMADGSVRSLDPRKTSENTIRAAITADGGEILPGDW